VKSLASVLIAEEERPVALQLQAALQKSCSAWPLVAVDNGEHALAYLRGKVRAASALKFPVTTLFLLSLTIGQVTAFQILDWIKRQPALRSLVIALVCGAGEIPEFERLSKYGVHAVLNRPILSWQVEALVAAVETSSPASKQLAVPAEAERVIVPMPLSEGRIESASPELLAALTLLTNSPPVSA